MVDVMENVHRRARLTLASERAAQRKLEGHFDYLPCWFVNLNVFACIFVRDTLKFGQVEVK
jgi:hypothetical protein